MITRFMDEFDINTSTIIGVLEEKKMDLIESGTIMFELDDDDELLDE